MNGLFSKSILKQNENLIPKGSLPSLGTCLTTDIQFKSWFNDSNYRVVSKLITSISVLIWMPNGVEAKSVPVELLTQDLKSEEIPQTKISRAR